MVLVHGVLLHGQLEVTVYEAEQLWEETERSTRERITRAVTLHSVLNPYVVVSLEHLPKPPKRILKTKCAYSTDSPKWDHVQTVDVATVVSYVLVHVKSSSLPDQSKDWFRHKSLGTARIKAERILWNVVDGWLPLAGLNGITTDSKNRGRIRIKIRYNPIDSLSTVSKHSVPGTYFRPVQNCHVQLFQDAHCPQGAVLHIPGSSDKLYESTTFAANANANATPTPTPTPTPTTRPPLYSPVSPLSDEPLRISKHEPRRRRRLFNYFEEIYHAILNATKLVYIAGWSVDTTLHLLRESPKSDHDTTTKSLPLGDLLVAKANEGVAVLLLVWDEVLSTNKMFFRSSGVMNTKDEITKAFFRDTKVKAAVVPRIGRAGQLVKSPLVPTLFTFHEKMVVTDIPAFDITVNHPFAGEPRQLAAFVGGLDLTYGRWDTPEHSLFGTLAVEHASDFHNACFDVSRENGPREPWHDAAAMITGPVVRDIVCCFEERWRRQGLGVAHLLDIDKDPDIVSGRFEHPTESWTVQVFRSIDERSAIFGRDSVRRLETKKGRYIDRSIHHAYVHYTRSAKRFIYIEQQYLIGSSDQWLLNGHKDATNIIPHELALKIARGIITGNYVRLYVVIPMWPEGLATDTSVQKILFFQFRTIEMIMKTVAKAIEKVGLRGAHPTDFVSIFCLGTREAPAVTLNPIPTDSTLPEAEISRAKLPGRRISNASSSAGSSQTRASRASRGSRSSVGSVTSRISAGIVRHLSGRRSPPRTFDEERLAHSRRHPIYQHAKLFIADDEIAITGSSNINERSMSGFRDTELGVSMFQPDHLYSSEVSQEGALPSGEVSRFRKRMWAEHVLGKTAQVFPEVLKDPGTVECMRAMRRVAEQNWKVYMATSAETMTSHLLPYPYDIDSAGNVYPRLKEFPDTRGSVQGFLSNIIPNILVS